MRKVYALIIVLSCLWDIKRRIFTMPVTAFCPLTTKTRTTLLSKLDLAPFIIPSTKLYSTKSSDSSKKKRRRKNPVPSEQNLSEVQNKVDDSKINPNNMADTKLTDATTTTTSTSDTNLVTTDRTTTATSKSVPKTISKSDVEMLSEIAKFEFKDNNNNDEKLSSTITKGIQNADSSSTIPFIENNLEEDDDNNSQSIPLPDITDVRRKKRREEEMKKRLEEEQDNASKVKINRKDRKALLRLLEQQPFADADDSYFEEEAYSTVSALLGERAKSFLGIPFGPLQAGHFVGSLVIIMMAFIEYPGFPLTNLPTPLRDSLQGGLAAVYAINTALAVSAVFQAQARGQPVPLWVMKTLGIGGLAYDQLTQLPTLKELENAKNVKGKRAMKKRS